MPIKCANSAIEKEIGIWHFCAIMASRKGSRNKRTLLREYRTRIATEEPKLAAALNDGLDYIGDSLAYMGEAMHFFMSEARAEVDKDKKRSLLLDVVNVADKLAPFRYPKYATLRIGTDGSKSTLVQDGVSSLNLLEDLIAFMEEKKIPAQKLIDVTPNEGVANRTNGKGN